MYNRSEIEALVSLLDETDESLYNQLKEKIIFYGVDIVPVLEKKWEITSEEYVRQRIENITHQIQFEDVCIELKNWLAFGSSDILKGYIIVSKYHYPELNPENINNTINHIVRDVWLELNDTLTPLEKIKVLNHIIFDVHNFSSSIFNYNSPQGLFLNILLESRRGNSLSLGLLYIIVARKLGFPIYGVNLPEHFILTYLNESADPEFSNGDDILFYINAFSRGAAFTRTEIDSYLKHLKLEMDESFYSPCSNVDLIKRLLNNLKMAYDKTGYPEKVKEIEMMIEIL
ncbi:MAG: transglutaminase-like domain-containing protein [Bacteroidota bacterium]|nr:transglutaminase-like domain-containing protein [Bacteroidota bacterium]